MQRQDERKVQVDKCKYTVVPIQNQDHREKLQKFIQSRGKIKLKGSLCRFYLRGICIMKSQFCKFAHGVKQLNLECEADLFYLSDKERRKRQFTQKRQFNQTALFILKNVKYTILYQFQFSQRYKKSNMPVHDIDTISTDRAIRNRIRQIMHRQNWDGFIDFIQKRFPQTNYPISFISFWYANFGFDKPQTRCKFGDFLKYAVHVRKYIQIDIVFPPNTQPCIYLINTQSKVTLLEQNAEQLYNMCMKQKEQYSKQKMDEFLERALPSELSKKYMCRYFMAGNCQQSAEQCLYAHSIDQLSQRYELGQHFPPQYRQPVMPIEVRMNFTSLYDATRKYQQYQTYSLQDINLNSTIRNQLRQKVHHELFGDFLKFLQAQLSSQNNKHLFFQIQLKQLQKYYNGAGFNHTNQNKFQHLQGSLWDLGYYMQDVASKDEVTLQKKKVTFVYKIPPISYLNDAYRKIIKECVESQLKTLSQHGVLLESALRRAIYSYPKQSILPLHVYLRFRNVSLQEVITQSCPQQYIDRIFFQSGQQNVKKIAEIVKKYMKKNKNYITKVDQIQRFIKQNKKDEVNLNHHFINLRTIIQTTILDSGKKIYFWPFDNNAFVVDISQLQNYKKNYIDLNNKKLQKDESLSQFKNKIQTQQQQVYLKKRIVIVDNFQALSYAKKYLSNCAILGVDLQGKLRTDGFVDLVQISGVKRDNQKQIQHKQIFIFDIWQMRKNIKTNKIDKQANEEGTQSQFSQMVKQNNEQNSQTLYQLSINLLKTVFQNENKIKILHDCRQDSIALKHLLSINIRNVFDTSGFDIYLSMKNVYENQNNLSSHNLLRRIYDVKVPGLNTILDTYKAPNGINIFKQSMKKKFGEINSRPYFQIRPIDDQFLQYSARDVQDLIEVYQNMIQMDTQSLSSFIGSLYSSC